MDIHLPVEDGYQALAKLREHPKFTHTCIIAVTAEATDSNMRRARAEGFDGFIGKPISPSLFPEQMKKVFQGEEVWEL
jgi:two-component system cell cycle response regulator DivK